MCLHKRRTRFMKFLVTTLLLTSSIFSTTTYAGNGSSLGELLYMQNKGEVVYNNDTTLGYGKHEISRFSSTGTKLRNLENKTRKIITNQTASYGFSDNFLAGAGVEIAFRDENKNVSHNLNNGTPTDLEPAIKNPGFGDPYLFAQYRFLNHAENKFNWDLTTKITPAVVQAARGKINGTKASQGDHQQGGHMIGLGTQVGKHFGNLETMLYVNYQLNLRANTKRIDNSSPANTDADLYYDEDIRSIYSAGTFFQYKMFERTWINLGVDFWANSKSHKETTQRFTGNKFSEDTTAYWSGQIKSELRFILLRDFYLRLGYAYLRNANYEINFHSGTVKTHSDAYSNNNSHNYLAGFTAYFN